jgi:type VI secretion system protein ImpL
LLTLIGLVALCVTIWLAGPLITIDGVTPLASEFSRILLIAGILGTILVVTLVRHWLAWRANRRMIRSLLESETLGAITDNRSSDEIAIIRERFEAAMAALQSTAVESGGKTSYLAQLPWYIIIGPSGAGKTTILKNSGLEFPLAERLGNDPVSGIGGTRNCDWWFTDQAVLIDTAGRYTTQDVNAEVDRAAWRGFLDLLKAHRSRRPINGVLIAISLSDVLLRSETERKRHVDALRKRLLELMKTFGFQLPVYVLITKCDLIAGFSEYFDDLDEPGRQQVWGMTFPMEGAAERLADNIGARHRALAQNLEDGLLHRMHGEPNLGRRGAMFSFPKEFAGLRTAVGGFVYDVFRPNKFEPVAMLRGVYFTSGTQEGTPIDRLIGVLGRNFGLRGAAQPAFTGRGKAFFVHRLLTDVVFAEQGVAGTDRKLERRLAVLHGAGYAAAVAMTFGLTVLWYGAYARSEARIDETVTASQTVLARQNELRRPLSFANLLPVLNAARDLRIAAGEGSLFAWLDGFGLSATPTLGPSAENAYDRALIAFLLPSLADRFSARLQAGLSYSSPNDLGNLREVLKVYLMLGDASRFDRNEVTQAARTELSLAFPLEPERRADMSQHIDRLMQILPHPIELDRRLVATVRARLTREPQVEQVYLQLLREADQDPRLHRIDLSAVIGSTSLQMNTVRNTQLSRASIPGVFTRDGFYQFVIPRLPVLVREQQGNDWVLAADRVDDAMSQRVTREVANRYIQDYISNWTAAINSVAAIQFDDLQRGLGILQGLAQQDSALQRFIDTVKENTDLPPPGEDSIAKGDTPKPTQTASLLPSVSGVANQAATSAVTSALGDIPWPGKTIGAPFVPLLQFAAGTNTGAQAPIGRVRDELARLFGTVSAVANGPDPRQAAFQLLQDRVKNPTSDVFTALRSDSALSPPPVRNILSDVAKSSWAVLLGLSHDYVNDAWRRDVVPVCEGAIDQRFPIFSGAKDDVTLQDFSDFFRTGGIIDEFFSKYMSPLVVDQRNGFAPAKVDGVPVPLRADALEEFQRARVIRSAFFNGAGAAPAVKFSIKPVFLHQDVLSAVLQADAKEIVYRHEPPRPSELEWPTRSDSSTVSVTLTLLDGTQQKTEASGPWALFRLVDASQLATRGTAEKFTFTIGDPNGARVTYDLRAGSVSNPFSLDALRNFRCPDAL